MQLDYITDLIEHRASQSPDRLAAIDGDRRITFSQLWKHIERFAAWLIAHGVEPGDRVAMISPPREEFLTVYLGAAQAGALFVGINPKSTLEEIRYVLSDATPKVLVSVRAFEDRDLAPDLRALRAEESSPEQYLVIGEAVAEVAAPFETARQQGASPGPAPVDRKPDDGTLIVYTSGTTGKPKGAVLSHRNILASVTAQARAFHFGEETRVLLHMPISHVAGTTELSLATYVSGGAIVFLQRFTPEGTLELVQNERVTVLGQIPTMFLLELGLPNFAEYDLSSIELYVWAGAAAPLAMVLALRRTGTLLVTGYGMTEVAGFVTYSLPDDDVETLAATAGRVHPSFELRLVDSDRREVSLGEVGEIEIRGACVMRGYWNRPEATSEVLHEDGWYSTGDVAQLDAEGRIVITGRLREMFKSGGENVYPREIEAVLEVHPDVALAAVVSRPDPTYGEVGVAFVLPKPGKDPDVDALRTHCRAHLTGFKIPKEFRIEPELPMLATGKIDKRALSGRT